MGRTFRSVATTTAVCAVLVFLPGAGSQAGTTAADPPGTVRVGPSAPSTENDVYDPVAGSSTFIAYTRVVQLAGRHDVPPPSPDEATRTLFARSASGTTVALGPVSYRFENYSLVGSTLVADVQNDAGHTVVHWWNTMTAAAGTLTLAQGGQLISAAPGGFVYATEAGHVYEESVAGTVTDLGTPFPGAGPLRGAGGDSGFVVIASSSDIAYRTFASSGHFTTLHAHTKLGLVCEAVVEQYAGCYGVNGDDYPRRVLLIPLSGGAPTTSTDDPGDVAVSGSTLLWTGEVAGAGPTGSNLHSLQAGSSTVTVSSVKVGSVNRPALVSAYGVGVGVTPSGDRVISVTPASSHATTLVNKVASPVSAATFSLTPGRVAYVADERVAGSSKRLSAFSAELTPSGSVLHAATPTVVHAGAYYDAVAASGPVTAYESRPRGDSVTLDVAVRGKRTHTIAHVFADGHPSLSGDRLLYLKSGRRGGHSTSVYYVYDVADRTTSRVYTDPNQCCLDTPALAGNHLAYVRADGSVWRKNLGTGRSVRLAGPRKGFQYATIYAVGHYVAWEITYLSTHHGVVVTHFVDRYRNVHTGAAAVKLAPASLVGLSRRGAILGRFPDQFKGLDGPSASYSLRTFGGGTVRLLPRQALDAYPQIAGSTVAWIDSNGVLKAAPLPS